MTQRNVMIDEVYARLVNAPNDLNPTINEVLSALGMMASAVMREGFTDPAVRQNVADWFMRGLQASVNRNNAVVRH